MSNDIPTPMVSVPATLLSGNPSKWPHGEFVPLGTMDALRGLLDNLWRYSFEYSYDEGEPDAAEVAWAIVKKFDSP